MRRKYDWPGVEYGSKEYYRLYREANAEKLREYKRNYDKLQYKLHPEREHARRKRWINNNLEKSKCHNAVKYALKTGKLIKQPCERCQMTDKQTRIVAHHEDYSLPLQIMWLCELHHKERHKELRLEGTKHQLSLKSVGSHNNFVGVK